MNVVKLSQLAKERLKQGRNIRRTEIENCINNSVLLNFTEEKFVTYRERCKKNSRYKTKKIKVKQWKFTITNYNGVEIVFDSSKQKYPTLNLVNLTKFIANDLIQFTKNNNETKDDKFI